MLRLAYTSFLLRRVRLSWLDGCPWPHPTTALSNTEDAASALSTALPKAIAERIDWSTLKHSNLSLVDQKLRGFYSDIVFSVQLEGQDVFIYVLLEHQSTGDKLMAFRMLRYVVLLWDSILRNQPDLQRLPVVLPIVIHNGKSRWTSPLELSELISVPDNLRQLFSNLVPSFRFVLDDLSATDDQALRQRSLTTMMLACMVLLKKAPGSTDLTAELGDWMDVFSQIALAPNGLDALRLLLAYISVTTNAAPEHVHQFAKLFGSVGEEAFMTAAEKISQEGQAKLLVRQLSFRFGELPAETVHRVYEASDENIALWAERVLFAKSLEEVFAD
jgi:hypothetical protein